MLKRFLSLLIGAAMLISLLPAAMAEDEALPFIEFTVLSLDYPEGFDDFPLVKQAKEKFNFDFTVQQVAWDTWDETVRTYAATGSLPEVIAWYNLNYGEYKQWAEQGVFKALPDMAKYPLLKENLDKLDVDDYLYVDGQLYCNPKINNNQPVNQFKNYMTLYRRDWAKAVGLDYAPVQEVTYAEFVEYLNLVKEKDPGNVGDGLIACDPESGGEGWVAMAAWWNHNIDRYYEKDGKVYWGARDPESLEGVLQVKALYDAGLLYRDGYADTEGEARFRANRVAAHSGNVAIKELVTVINELKLVDAAITDEDLGVFAIRMPDGKFHCDQMGEYWAAFAFSGECRDEVMDRWLQVGNWLLEQEQVETYAYGTYGEDWEKDAEGNVNVFWTDEDITKGKPKAYISDQRVFQKFFMLEGADLWLEGNPALRPILQDDIYLDYYKFLGEAENREEVVYTPTNYELEFLSTPSKDQYGSLTNDVKNAVIQAVVSDEPEKVWNNFLEESAFKVDMVIAEMEEALAANAE